MINVLEAINRAQLGAGHVWLVTNFRQQATDWGVFVAAKRWRKQGMPIDVALAVCRDAMRPTGQGFSCVVNLPPAQPVKPDTLLGAAKTFRDYYAYRES